MANEVAPIGPASTLDFRALKEFAEYIGQDAWGIYARMVKAKAYGLDPAHYDECIDVIDGRNGKQFHLTAKAKGSLVKRHPRYDYQIVESTPDVARIKFIDSEQGSEWTNEMTRERADTAGYSQSRKGVKDGWQKNPGLMLFYRCLSEGIRMFCPDVLGGANAYDADEVDGDVVSLERRSARVEVVEPAPVVAAVAPPPAVVRPVAPIDAPAAVPAPVSAANGVNGEAATSPYERVIGKLRKGYPGFGEGAWQPIGGAETSAWAGIIAERWGVEPPGELEIAHAVGSENSQKAIGDLLVGLDRSGRDGQVADTTNGGDPVEGA